MVIEDDQHIADLVELYLRQEGFRVVQAGTGENGLDAVRNRRLAALGWRVLPVTWNDLTHPDALFAELRVTDHRFGGFPRAVP